MIACDDMDLFGGRISTISAVEFCCQIETSGEGLLVAPVTAIHDLQPSGDPAEVQPVIILSYDAIWHTTSLSVPHKLIVNFMESLAAGDNRISLRQALEMASLKFGYYGAWKWPVPSASGFDAQHAALRSSPANHSAAWLAGLATPGRDRLMDLRSHIDSPLAD